MYPIVFPEATQPFIAPPGLEESQVATIAAYRGEIAQGNLEGAPVIVTAWKPTAAELEVLNQGGAVYVSFLSDGLPGHMLTTSFHEATHPNR